MKREIKLLIGMLLGAFFSLASAQESGFYLGGSVGQSMLRQWCDPPTLACEDKDTAWKLLAGYQFNRYLGVEGSYIDWGEVTGTTLGSVDVAAEQQGYGIAATGSLPLGPQFSVFAKLGVIFVQQETKRLRPNPSTVERDETEMQYGFGAKYRLARNWAIRGEWEFTDKRQDETTIRAQLISIGAEYRF
jgi:OOP family OmpA-OmpF porin